MHEPTRLKEAPEGRYSNFLRVGQNSCEFVLDFGQCYASEMESVHTRIVTSPSYAKDFGDVLQRALEEYDRELGQAVDGPK